MAPNFADTKRQVEALLDYKISDLDLLKEAFWAAGPTVIGNRQIPDNNSRLALLGDTVMRSIMIDDLYQDPEFNFSKGSMQEACTKILCNKNLANVGRSWYLDECLVTKPYHAASSSQIATTVEAIFGALWIDCGKDTAVVKKAMERMEVLAR